MVLSGGREGVWRSRPPHPRTELAPAGEFQADLVARIVTAPLGALVRYPGSVLAEPFRALEALQAESQQAAAAPAILPRALPKTKQT